MAAPKAKRICLSCDLDTTEPVCPKCKSPTVLVSGVSLTDLDLVGQRVGANYDVTAVLGRGGMGVVYRGVQRSMDRPVAIKVIAPMSGDAVSVLKRFQREARITSRLNHPNTIRVFDSGVTEDGLMYLVMELLEGRELSKEIKVGRLPLAKAISVATQVLRALNEAHGLGIVHRDLKPANIFLQHVTGGDVLVKVMDFGIAKMVNEGGDNSSLTMAGHIVGSPPYMSPEQIKTNVADARSDLYSLGIILFEMLAGHPPFSADSPTGVLMKHLMEDPPELGELVSDFRGHRSLHHALTRLLAKEADDRPQNAQEAIALLQTVLDEASTLETLAPAIPPAARKGGKAQALDAQVAKTASRPAPFSADKTIPARDDAEEDNGPTQTMHRPGMELPADTDPPTGSVEMDAPVTDPEGGEAPAAGFPWGYFVAGLLVVGVGGGGVVAWKTRGAPSPITAPAIVPPQQVTGPPIPDGYERRPVGNANPDPAPAPTPPVSATPPAATPAAKSVRSVTVKSTPAGAEVYNGSKLLGKTPYEAGIPEGEKLVVILKLAGHVDLEKTLDGTEPNVTAELAASPAKKEPEAAADPAPRKDPKATPRTEPDEKADTTTARKPRTKRSPIATKESTKDAKDTKDAKEPATKKPTKKMSDDALLEDL